VGVIEEDAEYFGPEPPSLTQGSQRSASAALSVLGYAGCSQSADRRPASSWPAVCRSGVRTVCRPDRDRLPEAVLGTPAGVTRTKAAWLLLDAIA
jgi:hypothetical protein